VTIRLTKSNYLLLRAQLLPYLRSTKLHGYLDGSLPAPPKQVPASSAPDAELITNPAYERWCDQDQQVLSGLLSSMSADVLPDVVTAKSSKAVWDTLQRQFTSTTHARMVQIHVELVTTKKRDLSATDYFCKVKGLATELVASNAAITDDEILAGLSPDYDPLVTSVTVRARPLTLDVVYAHLMVFEARQPQHQAALQLNTNSSAHYAGHGGPQMNRGGGRHHGRGHSSHGGRFSGDRQGFSSHPPPLPDLRQDKPYCHSVLVPDG
jgi:hypothetical protein